MVVWVVHLVQEINGEPPGQTSLGHKHMLKQNRRVSTTDKQTSRACVHTEAYRCDEMLRNITDKSFSAVGLFFGFLVRDTLTKLWKLVDLKRGDGLVFNEPTGTVSARLAFRSPTICFCLLALEAGSCSLTSGTGP